MMDLINAKPEFYYLQSDPLITTRASVCMELLSRINQPSYVKLAALKVLCTIYSLSSYSFNQLSKKFVGNVVNKPLAAQHAPPQNAKVDLPFFFLDQEDTTPTEAVSIQETLSFFNKIKNIAVPAKIEVVKNKYFEIVSGREFPIYKLGKRYQDLIPSSTGMIITPTVKSNLITVQETIDDPCNKLIEGDTGIGKTATVMEACHLMGIPLIRFNMSDRTTIKDFFGKIEISSGERMSFKFCEGPFTYAFENGFWLLIDEVNLAPACVVQALETALDTGILIINDDSNAAEREKKYTRHHNFRLFATQNPASGDFKSHRHALAESFASRFQTLVFHQLPPKEWEQVVKSKLLPSLAGSDVEKFALEIVDTHLKICKLLQENALLCVCSSLYTTTIREMLRWCDGIKHLVSANVKREEAFASEAFAIYAARFSPSEGFYRDLSTLCKFNPHSATRNFSATFQNDIITIKAGFYQYSVSASASDIRAVIKEFISETARSLPVVESLVAVHRSILRVVLSTEFIFAFGLQPVGFELLKSVVSEFNTVYERTGESDRALFVSTYLYVNLFRMDEPRNVIVTEIGAVLKFNCSALLTTQNSWSISSPLILSERVISAMSLLVRAIALSEPVLLIGGVASGKTKILNTLARLCSIQT